MISEKQKNILIVIAFLIIIIVSLFLAYENGVIGKAVIGSIN